MPKIQFVKNISGFEVENGANLMQALLAESRPVASSCHGQGICSKCRVRIVAGTENLSLETENEKSLRIRNRIEDDQRISCQATVLGDVTIDTPYW